MNNIEDQPKKAKEKKDNQLNIKLTGYTVKEELSQETMNILNKLANQEKRINYRKLNFGGGNNRDYDFNSYKHSKELFRAFYYREILLRGAEKEQNEFDDLLDALKECRPITRKYVKSKKVLLINAKNYYDGREIIIDDLKIKYFH